MAILDEAVSCLQQQNVCTLPYGADIPNFVEESALFGVDGVGLVVLPRAYTDDTTNVLPPATLAQNILNQVSNLQTVIVAIDKGSQAPLFAVKSFSLDAIAVTEKLNTVAANNHDIGAVILTNQEILQPVTIAEVSVATTPEPVETSVISEPVAFGVPLVLVAAIVIAKVRSIGKRKRIELKNQTKVDMDLFSTASDEDVVEKELLRLLELSKIYSDDPQLYSLKYNNSTVPMCDRLNKIIEDFQELVRLLKDNNSEQQIKLAMISYREIFQKLLKIVEVKYFGNICERPEFWSDPHKRIQKISAATEMVASGILENIRQVNSSMDLDFHVILESLTQSSKQVELDDIYGN